MTATEVIGKVPSLVVFEADDMVDTLFFIIQIGGLVVIAIWALRNDRRARVAEQDGILAMKGSDQPHSQILPSDDNSSVPADAGTPSGSRPPPPRRRFTTP